MNGATNPEHCHSDPHLLFEDKSGESRYRLYLRRESDVSILFIRGSMLRAVPEYLVAGIEDILADASQGVAIDLSDCKYMCSSALSYLVRFHDRANAARKKVVLINPQQRVRDVLELLGLNRLFDTVSDLQAARQALVA